MADVLIGLATCHEAFLATPVVPALRAAGHTVRLAWFGTAAELAEARGVGLPDLPTEVAGDPGPTPRLVRAANFAARDFCRADVVLTLGHDAHSVALLQAARERRQLTIRLAAGIRPGRVEGDEDRLVADHAAWYCCVADDNARSELLREGKTWEAIAVVGSLAARALAAQPATPATTPFVWVAIEHTATTSPGRGGRLLAVLRQLAQRTSLPLRVAATAALRELVATDGEDIKAWFTPGDDDAVVQRDAARRAALIVTDSAGWQEFAAALGTPCAVLPFAGWRRDLAATGHVIVAAAISELAATAHAALAQRRAPLPVADVGTNVVAALQRWLHPANLQPDTSALPSDGDATGRTFDAGEVAFVTAALRSGTLNSTKGTFVARFEREFAQWLGAKHTIACASGSAAVHCAIAALRLQAGDEVITTPITDMGALTPIFYEGAVPVFADVDPETLNVTAATIERQITPRTRAIVVTHLFGCPCDLDAVMALAERRGLPVIEDAAQAFGATWRGRKVGTFGRLAAFSLQQGKHITTGEGGIVATDDGDLARRVFLFVNKAWGYGDAKPDHYFPALNYRLTELQGAVACAQLPKLDGVVSARRRVAQWLRDELTGLAGIHCPDDPQQGTHCYWKFGFRVDATVVPGGAVALGARMREQGIACVPRYVQKPAFECEVFREWRRSPVTSLPLRHNARGETNGPLFHVRDYPGAAAGLEQVVVLPINERYQPEHVLGVAAAIRKAHRELRK